MISDPDFRSVTAMAKLPGRVELSPHWTLVLKAKETGTQGEVRPVSAGGIKIRWEGTPKIVRLSQDLSFSTPEAGADFDVEITATFETEAPNPSLIQWIAILEETDAGSVRHKLRRESITQEEANVYTVVARAEALRIRQEKCRLCIQFEDAPKELILRSVGGDIQLTGSTPVWGKLPGDDATSEKHWMAELYAASSSALGLEVAAAQALAIKYLRRQLVPGGNVASSSLKVSRDFLLKGVSRIYVKLGLRQALARIFIHAENLNAQSAAVEELAKRISADDRETATRLYRLSYDLVPSSAKAAKIAAKMFMNGSVTYASRLLELAPDAAPSKILPHLRLAKALQSGLTIPSRRVADEERWLDVAYVAAGTLPFLTTGYAIRTHQTLRALAQVGVSAGCYARPGFPHDRRDAVDVELADGGDLTTDGVTYSYSPVQPLADDSASYIERVSDILEKRFRSSRPAVVHAASNYMNALPALIAARRAGVPFIYEVRGLWELTAASRLPGWEATERFKLDREIEMLVAREADHVFAITRGVAEELAAGGLPPTKITLLPNAVDPDLFYPVAPDEKLAAELGINGGFTLVYAGSLTVYEGLDDLINAVAQLRQRGTKARLVIVGEGVARAALEKQVSELDLTAAVTFVGRVTPDDIRRYLSLADAVALPRKAFKVCKVVSPLKPFEAMAMGKPVVLTDLPALREIVQDGVTGLIAAPEDPDDLTRTLLNLALDPNLRARLGKAARRWVVEERSWLANAELLKGMYAEHSLRLRNVA